MYKKINKNIKRFVVLNLVLSLAAFILLANNAIVAKASVLTNGGINLTDSRPSTANVTYTGTFDNVTTSAIKCIQLVFSTTAAGSAAPSGINTNSVALVGTSTYIPTPGSWAASGSTNGTIKITFASGETPAGATGRTVVLSGITNASTAGTTYFVKFNTYNNTDCATSPVDSTVLAYQYTTGQSVSLTVDPALTFTISAIASGSTVNSATTTVTTTPTTIPFGTVTSGANAIAAHDMTVVTNAGSGYTVYTRYSGALTSGTNTIADFAGSNATPTAFTAAGTEGFGYTTSSTSLAGTAARFNSNKWAAFTTTGVEVAHSIAPVSSDVTRIGYQIGISGTTKAGSYTTSVILTAVPMY